MLTCWSWTTCISSWTNLDLEVSALSNSLLSVQKCIKSKRWFLLATVEALLKDNLVNSHSSTYGHPHKRCVQWGKTFPYLIFCFVNTVGIVTVKLANLSTFFSSEESYHKSVYTIFPWIIAVPQIIPPPPDGNIENDCLPWIIAHSNPSYMVHCTQQTRSLKGTDKLE